MSDCPSFELDERGSWCAIRVVGISSRNLVPVTDN